MQPNLKSTLSAMLEHYRQKIARNLLLSLSYCRRNIHWVSLMPSAFPKQALVFMCLQHKSFENTVRKGEIAHHEQFLLFPTAFSTCLEKFLPFSSNLKVSSANFHFEVKNCPLIQGYSLNHTITTSNNSVYQAF